MRKIGVSLLILIFLLFYGAMNYYTYANLVQVLPPGLVLPLQVAMVFLALAYPTAQALKTRVSSNWFLIVGALWMGFLSIALAVFVFKDLLLWFYPLRIQLVAVILVLVLTVLAAFKAWWQPRHKAVSIVNKKLSYPLSIVHLSDIHLGAMTSARWLERVIAQVNNMNADLVVVTGDLVEDSFARIEEFIPTMSSITAKYGVFAVSGNHEHYQDIEHFHRFCQATGITVVDGRSIQVTEGINLIGLGGKVVAAKKNFADEIQRLLREVKPEDYNILLIHYPVGFSQSAKLGIDLQLSGHTHKGQVPPLSFLVHLAYRYAYGLHALGAAYIYTSSGTGTWGPPLRLGSNSEIVRIDVSSF